MLSDEERAVMIIDTFQRITDLAGQVETLSNHFAAIREACAKVVGKHGCVCPHNPNVMTANPRYDRNHASWCPVAIAEQLRTAQPAASERVKDSAWLEWKRATGG